MAAFYIAGAYARRFEFRQHADQLRALGHTVTSSWIDTHEDGQDFEAHAAGWSKRDFEDIEAADIMLSFTEPKGSTNTRGGRHVELGYALAKEKLIVVIGRKETTFHYLMPTDHVYAEFEDYLREVVDVKKKSVVAPASTPVCSCKNMDQTDDDCAACCPQGVCFEVGEVGEPPPQFDRKPTNPKDAVGCKKVPLGLVPSTAMAYQAMVHLHGAIKYGAYNWRAAGVRSTIYYDAMLRHLGAWLNGQDDDPDSGQPHLAHVAACCNIILDAKECGKLNDDRPPPAPVAALQARLNEVAKGWLEK